MEQLRPDLEVIGTLLAQTSMCFRPQLQGSGGKRAAGSRMQTGGTWV